MLGYVTADNTNYIKTIKLLDLIFSTSPVKYYRSGANKNTGTIVQLLSRSQFLKAQEPLFYQGNNPEFPGVSSAIAETIKKSKAANSDGLFVLITDLEQDGDDAIKITQQIGQTYLNQQNPDYAVGIVAVRSEFKGRIYNPKNPNISFEYPNSSSQKLRPFYIIFIGHYSQIAEIFRKIKSDEKDLFNNSLNSQFTIFYPQKVTNDILYVGNEGKLPKGISKQSPLKSGTVGLKESSQEKTDLFKIANADERSLPINYSIDFTPLPDTLPIDENLIQTKITVEFFNLDTKNFQTKPEGDPLTKALQLDSWKIDNNKFNFVTNVKPSELKPSGIYQFKVDAVATGIREITTEWDDWDLEAGKNNDGSQTRGLLPFLKGLRGITNNLMANNPPGIGRFCYGIQKD
jgi:hypothetical protein